jgi:hypothetical protein
MNRDFLKEAIADAKAVKESAIANAKVALEEAFTPQLKSMLAAKLEEMETSDEDDVNEYSNRNEEDDVNEYSNRNEEDDTMKEARAKNKETRKTEDERYGNDLAEEKEMDEEINLDEILAEIDNEVSEDARTKAEEEGYEDGMEDEKEDMEDDELDLDDMSDDDLKSFIEDVIADMVSAGELEAGTEFEAKDEEVEDNEVDIEVEDEVEVTEEMKGKSMEDDTMEEEMKSMEDDTMDEVNTSGGVSMSYKKGNKYDEDFMKAIKGDVKNLSSTLKASMKKALGLTEGEDIDEINTSGGINMSYTKGNPYDEDFMKAFKGDISKLSQGLKDKLKSLFKEEMELDEAYNTIEALRSELHEVNLLNAKLLYTNKIFKSKSLTESQKGKVLEAFDKANDVKGVKLVYETLDKNMKVKYKSSVTEGIVGSASKGISNVRANKKQPIVESNEMVSRFQKLAGIK